MPSVKTLQISFSLPLRPSEIKQWRGAFIEMAGWEDDIFHNHANETQTDEEGNATVVKTERKYHYRYPAVQYRVRRGRAAVFAINEGVDRLQKVLATGNWQVDWKEEETQFQIEELRVDETLTRLTTERKSYKLNNWIALTEVNHKQYLTCDGMVQRLMLLEKLLTNHIIGFLKNMDCSLEEKLIVKIQSLKHERGANLHNIVHKSFTVGFDANVVLPEQIGLGKGVSLGYGRLVKERGRGKVGFGIEGAAKLI